MNARSLPTELGLIQRWMQSVIMHPDGVEAGIESPEARGVLDVDVARVEEVIGGSSAQTSVERLHVYSNAYYARLLEVLASEFPTLTYALGEELFQEFALGYLRHFPSRSYTLSDLGLKFPEYLALTRPPREPPTTEPDWADFLVDLATLERTFSEVFDGPGVEGKPLLSPSDLRAIAWDRWPSVRLAPVPCLRLAPFRFAVHDYARAVRLAEHPDLPEPANTWLVFTRRDYVVRRVSVPQAEYAALAVLVGGGTIAASLAAAQSCWGGDSDQLASDVQRWFCDWSAAGYFLGVDDRGEPVALA